MDTSVVVMLTLLAASVYLHGVDTVCEEMEACMGILEEMKQNITGHVGSSTMINTCIDAFQSDPSCYEDSIDDCDLMVTDTLPYQILFTDIKIACDTACPIFKPLIDCEAKVSYVLQGSDKTKFCQSYQDSMDCLDHTVSNISCTFGKEARTHILDAVYDQNARKFGDGVCLPDCTDVDQAVTAVGVCLDVWRVTKNMSDSSINQLKSCVENQNVCADAVYMAPHFEESLVGVMEVTVPVTTEEPDTTSSESTTLLMTIRPSADSSISLTTFVSTTDNSGNSGASDDKTTSDVNLFTSVSTSEDGKGTPASTTIIGTVSTTRSPVATKTGNSGSGDAPAPTDIIRTVSTTRSPVATKTGNSGSGDAPAPTDITNNVLTTVHTPTYTTRPVVLTSSSSRSEEENESPAPTDIASYAFPEQTTGTLTDITSPGFYTRSSSPSKEENDVPMSNNITPSTADSGERTSTLASSVFTSTGVLSRSNSLSDEKPNAPTTSNMPSETTSKPMRPHDNSTTVEESSRSDIGVRVLKEKIEISQSTVSGQDEDGSGSPIAEHTTQTRLATDLERRDPTVISATAHNTQSTAAFGTRSITRSKMTASMLTDSPSRTKMATVNLLVPSTTSRDVTSSPTHPKTNKEHLNTDTSGAESLSQHISAYVWTILIISVHIFT